MSWFNGSYLVELLKDQNQRLTEQNVWLQTRVEVLTTQILEMKQQGFVHEPLAVQKPMTQGLPDVVEAAIMTKAKPGSALYGELVDYAQAIMHTGEVDQEHLADHIMKGANDA
jgi:hypothetical protein